MIRICGIAGPSIEQGQKDWVLTALAPITGVKSISETKSGVAALACAIRPGASPSGAIHSDGSLLVICSARIDGIAELRDRLAGHAPSSADPSPAELIAAAWRHWGRQCPNHLFGDYAFAIHDMETGETFCARDHIGGRPFYFVTLGDELAFASELAPLLALSGVSHELDESYVATALLRRDFEPRRTFYRDVRKLPAGHSLDFVGGKLELTRWWRPESIPIRHDISDADALAEARRLLNLAVDDRLAGATRCAVHLSGGLDSSIVSALACASLRRHGRPDPLGYCWQRLDGEGSPQDEIGWARAMAAELGIELHAPVPDARQLAEVMIADWTTGADGTQMFHEATVQRQAQIDGVDLILSGWGGDEGFSFGGSGHAPKLLAMGRWLELLRSRPTPGIKAALAIFAGSARLLLTGILPRPSARSLIRRDKSLIDRNFALRTPLLASSRIRRFGVQSTQIALLRHGAPASRIEDWTLTGARHGVAYSYPLLDRRLLEFVLSLPPRMFIRRGQNRWLAREVAKGLVPELVRTNTSKEEAVRIGDLVPTLADAYRLIIPMLDDPTAPLARARYVDMAALRKTLAEVDKKGVKLGRGPRTAIQFLDLK